MRDDKFEWNDRKAQDNLVWHGVTFEAAREAFKGVFAIDREDNREDHGEERYSLIGMSQGRLLFVAYAMRGDRIRIISARGGEPYEHRLYHEEKET
jgi:uncharacterized protein